MKIKNITMKSFFHGVGWAAIGLAAGGIFVMVTSDQPWLHKQPFTDFAFGYSLAFLTAAVASVFVNFLYPRSLGDLWGEANKRRRFRDCAVILIGVATGITYLRLGLFSPIMFKSTSPAMATGFMLGNLLWGEAASRTINALIHSKQGGNAQNGVDAERNPEKESAASSLSVANTVKAARLGEAQKKPAKKQTKKQSNSRPKKQRR
ncbi:hypothetical protein [Stenotrophomonas bentonitica]|uniref:hypothetical protein n=1 Tax=Stenotrophomonas bentonitica TaxID=1450134 RepID=UPI003BAC2965